MKRRLKKQYTELYDNPGSMFPGLRVVLFPNGEPGIWIQDRFNTFRLTASRGPAGIGIHIDRSIGSPPMTLHHDGPISIDAPAPPAVDTTHVSLTYYDSNPAAQAFKRWYGSNGTEPYPYLCAPCDGKGIVHNPLHPSGIACSCCNGDGYHPIHPGDGGGRIACPVAARNEAEREDRTYNEQHKGICMELIGDGYPGTLYVPCRRVSVGDRCSMHGGEDR